MRQRRLTPLSATEGSAIDLTPLIDVVFVVLIMFILAAPMLELDKVKLAQAPSREQADTTSMSSLSIHVHDDNTVWINKRAIDSQNLGAILKAIHQKDPKLRPQLFHDQKAFFGTYQMVKNAVEEAGFEELDVVLAPSK